MIFKLSHSLSALCIIERKIPRKMFMTRDRAVT